jgi:hypothetical protein
VQKRNLARLVGSGFGCSILASCSLLLSPTGQQCVASADCNSSDSAQAFECVAGLCVEATTPGRACDDFINANITDPPTLRFIVIDSQTGRPVADAVADLCFIRDVQCSEPIATALSDNEGRIALPYDRADGDLLVVRTRPQQRYFEDGVVSTNLDAFAAESGFALQVLPIALVESLFLPLFGKARDPARALLNLVALSCTLPTSLELTPGIVFEYERLDDQSPEGQLAYGVNGFPSRSADKTTADGFAMLVDEKPGFISMTAKYAATGEVFAGPFTHEIAANEFRTILFVPRVASDE